MFKKYVKGGYRPTPMENPPRICKSMIGVETAFDDCAKSCPKFELTDIPTVVIQGFNAIPHCKHMGFCTAMAHHLSQFAEEIESED